MAALRNHRGIVEFFANLTSECGFNLCEFGEWRPKPICTIFYNEIAEAGHVRFCSFIWLRGLASCRLQPTFSVAQEMAVV